MNRIRFSLSLLLLGLLVHSGYTLGQTHTYDSSTIERLANSFLETSHLPGFSLAVGKKGKTIYAKGFGFADIEKQVRMNPFIRLRAASVSKVITATAIGRLVSEGELDLDSPIKTYVPYIPKMYEDLTSRQLAGHTAGMVHRPKGNGYKKKQYSSIEETVRLFRSPLLFIPDSEYRYSTGGFNILAAVIEGASGMKYETYMEEKIFKALGMKETQPEDIRALSSIDAQLYELKDHIPKRLKKLINGSYKLPGAGFRTTPSDLVKLMHAYDGGLIAPRVVEEMYTSHVLKNGEDTQVGIGWRASIDAFGNACIEHAGNWQGTRSVVVYYPEDQLSIAIMINASCQVFIEEMAHIFAHLFKRNSLPIPPFFSEGTKPITVTFRSSEGEKVFSGEISFQGISAKLSTPSDGFLRFVPLIYLGDKGQYAAATPYGLHFVQMKEGASLQGDLFLYSTRNATPPIEDIPMVSFSE